MSAKDGVGAATLASAGALLPHGTHSTQTASLALGILMAYVVLAERKQK